MVWEDGWKTVGCQQNGMEDGRLTGYRQEREGDGNETSG